MADGETRIMKHGTTVKKLSPKASASTALTPSQSVYTPTFEEWLAVKQQEEANKTIFGDGRVYTGISVSDGIRDVLGNVYQEAVYEEKDKALLGTWNQILQTPAAYEELKNTYRLHYRKKPNYEPSPNQLLSLLGRAVDQASTAFANEAKVSVSDVLNQYAGIDAYGVPIGGYSGGSGSGGVSRSIEYSNPADMRLLADALAEEMIGRSVTEDEFALMMKRLRREESDSPQVSTRSGNTTVTKAGISQAERQEVLTEILREKPEWQEFQLTSGVLDAMSESIRGSEALDSGI